MPQLKFLLRNANLVLAKVRARGIGAHGGNTGWGALTKGTRSRGHRAQEAAESVPFVKAEAPNPVRTFDKD